MKYLKFIYELLVYYLKGISCLIFMRKRSVIPSLVNTYGLRPKGNRESENKLISKKLLKLTLKQTKKDFIMYKSSFYEHLLPAFFIYKH